MKAANDRVSCVYHYREELKTFFLTYSFLFLGWAQGVNDIGTLIIELWTGMELDIYVIQFIGPCQNYVQILTWGVVAI